MGNLPNLSNWNVSAERSATHSRLVLIDIFPMKEVRGPKTVLVLAVSIWMSVTGVLLWSAGTDLAIRLDGVQLGPHDPAALQPMRHCLDRIGALLMSIEIGLIAFLVWQYRNSMIYWAVVALLVFCGQVALGWLILFGDSTVIKMMLKPSAELTKACLCGG
jgi:hypothetical protein